MFTFLTGVDLLEVAEAELLGVPVALVGASSRLNLKRKQDAPDFIQAINFHQIQATN